MGEGDPSFIRLKLVYKVDLILVTANEFGMTVHIRGGGGGRSGDSLKNFNFEK